MINRYRASLVVLPGEPLATTCGRPQAKHDGECVLKDNHTSKSQMLRYRTSDGEYGRSGVGAGMHCYRASGALLPGERAVVRPAWLVGVLCTAADSNGSIITRFDCFQGHSTCLSAPGDVGRSHVDSATRRATGRVCSGCPRTPAEPWIKLVNHHTVACDANTLM